MTALDTVRELFRYNDVANTMVFDAVAPLGEEQLNQPLDIGPGSLRKILRHLLAGEQTWLRRQRGEVEAKWAEAAAPSAIDEVRSQLDANAEDRAAWLSKLTDADLARTQNYRDSKGTLYSATLHEMLLQAFVHSTHHRAQAVNAIRRVGGAAPDVDYMYSVRRAAI
jgi:uncharacterized damage-inducible protein DinB